MPASPVAPLTLAAVGALALILGIVLDVHLLWAAGVVALVVALGLFLYAALKPRTRRTRR